MNDFMKFSYWTVVVASTLVIAILIVFAVHLHLDKCDITDKHIAPARTDSTFGSKESPNNGNNKIGLFV